MQRTPWLLIVCPLQSIRPAPTGTETVKSDHRSTSLVAGREWSEDAGALCARVARACQPRQCARPGYRPYSGQRWRRDGEPLDIGAAQPDNVGGSCQGGEFVDRHRRVMGAGRIIGCLIPGLYTNGSMLRTPWRLGVGPPVAKRGRGDAEDLGRDRSAE